MKVKLLRKTLNENKQIFSLIRKYNEYNKVWLYSILKDGVFFNPYAQIHSIKVHLSYDKNCSEDQAIDYLRQTIKRYTYDVLHIKWENRDKLRKERAFEQRWKSKLKLYS